MQNDSLQKLYKFPCKSYINFPAKVKQDNVLKKIVNIKQ